MFVKLDKHLILDIPPLQVIINRYGAVESGEFRGISYYVVDSTKEQYLKEAMLPAKYRNDFSVYGMYINREHIPPHTDSDTLTTINIYVKTAGAVTKFYNVKNNAAPALKLNTQTDGGVYSYDQLELHSMFIAQPTEVWMLNVKQPHSVHCAQPQDRFAYVIQSDNIPFDDARKIFNL